jgi:hypothetical protein
MYVELVEGDLMDTAPDEEEEEAVPEGTEETAENRAPEEHA